MTNSPTPAANLRGRAIIAVLQALNTRDPIAKAAAFVVLMFEASITTGNVPDFNRPMLVTWTTLAGDTMGMRVQIENEMIAAMGERVQ